MQSMWSVIDLGLEVLGPYSQIWSLEGLRRRFMENGLVRRSFYCEIKLVSVSGPYEYLRSGRQDSGSLSPEVFIIIRMCNLYLLAFVKSCLEDGGSSIGIFEFEMLWLNVTLNSSRPIDLRDIKGQTSLTSPLNNEFNTALHRTEYSRYFVF